MASLLFLAFALAADKVPKHFFQISAQAKSILSVFRSPPIGLAGTQSVSGKTILRLRAAHGSGEVSFRTLSRFPYHGLEYPLRTMRQSLRAGRYEHDQRRLQQKDFGAGS
jgi:hypothetical protein